jgi:PAS domain S-box-containing protein
MAEKLAEAARKERAIVDNAADAIFSIDDVGKFIKANPACFKLLGYTSDELVGSPYSNIVLAEERGNTSNTISDIKAKNSEGSFETRIVRKDGTIADILWSAHWSASDGALFSVAHDITDRKELERTKQEFMFMVSHDMRSPLTSIMLTLNLLGEGAYGALNERGSERVGHAEENAGRLINLISELLDVEKLESGGMELHMCVLPVARLLQRSAQSVRALSESQSISITLPETDQEICGDEDRLVQVLVNLLSNAIKFSPNGSSIKISTMETQDTTEIRVQDQGRGIPEHLQDAIFDRFKQVKPADARQGTGTGLGLAICKAIISEHGGTIGVESEPGKGSTFWFCLPRTTS